MSLRTDKIKREIIPISLFCFLIGIFVIILMYKNICVIKNYVDIFKSQLKMVQINKTRLFVAVFSNRIGLYICVFLYSCLYKGRYNAHVLSAVFFFFYGMYLAMNCVAIGIKGIVPGFLLFIPQWLFYMSAFYMCINQNKTLRQNFNALNVLRRIIPVLLVLAGVLLETYVTQSLIFKLF